MKNTITLAQFRQLDKLITEYQDNILPDREEDFIELFLLTAEGDSTGAEEEAVMAEIEIYDHDNNSDYGTLSDLLSQVGVALDKETLLSPYAVAAMQRNDEWTPQPYFSDGSATWQGRDVRLYSIALLLETKA